MFVFRNTILFSLIVILTACGSSFPLREEVVDLGPLELSKTDTEVLPNKFLAAEANADAKLWRFLKSKGSPDIVELKKESWGPYRAHIFYLNDNYAYLLEEADSGWNIVGPEKIPPIIARGLGNVKGSKSQPPLALGNVPEELIYDSDFTEGYQRGSLSREAIKKGSLDLDNNLTEEDQQFFSSSIPGDIVHTVRSNKESLWDISKEYTGTGKNYQRLAIINGLKNANRIRPGQKIRIPRYLASSK